MKIKMTGLSVLLLFLCSTNSYAEFIGDLILQPRDKPYYEVMQDFSFRDKKGDIWTARKGYKTDGASIPPIFWPIIGDPFGGGFIKSAVIHDQACEDKTRTWQDTHMVFFEAMIKEGVSPTLAYTMYAVVYRFGPRWNKKTISNNYKTKYSVQNKICPTCKATDTLTINELETVTQVENLPTEVITEEKLKQIKIEVQKLEASGNVTLSDLENIKLN
ncbi:DUF1353 domain-containing protein [Acinetobacter haemolyticus]|uniref:DUF1353 domain-containing protein n=1 Tax=Acinetobacter haemolyticus TaxID=29430 RepID=UPI0013737328|nr:DUF1353 domain-containing protein [Acinetobacter haemolyticus]NAS06217.1 DUF1353 domain-containing protein [Acinetobacter haemolyticus]